MLWLHFYMNEFNALCYVAEKSKKNKKLSKSENKNSVR